MVRRTSKNRNDSLIIILLDTPWPVSVMIAFVVFAVMQWLIPMQATNELLLPVAKVFSDFAPVTALFFLFIGSISFFRNRDSSPPQQGMPRTTPTRTDHIPDASLSRTKANITDWSLELLQSLDWKRYEMLCAEYFKILGKRVETIEKGADGGIDARIFDNDSDTLEYAIQCKSWNSMVGVKEIRELFGVMAHESAGKGIFMSTSWFSDDARKFADEHKDKLFLIDGELFLSMLSNLPEEKQTKLLAFVTEGDYTTPTCASCGIKLIRRSGKSGEFWGCMNYPKCRFTLKIAKRFL